MIKKRNIINNVYTVNIKKIYRGEYENY